MATPVEVPKLGNTVEECLISRWVKHKGDAVTAGELVAEIETDKATFELTAPVDGTLLETYFDEGALVPVFTTLFVVGAPGETVNRISETGSETSTPPSRGISLPVPEALVVDKPRTATTILSPRARRFATEHNLDVHAVTGSGPNGRVLESDLRRHHNAAPPKPARTSNIRDRIARRMRESLSSTAQYTLHTSADATGLLTLRARIKATPGLSAININDLVTYCAIDALLDVPALNAEYIDGQIREHPDVHMGFACDTPRGLLVPVIRDAHLMAIDELAMRAKELAAQAVAGTISPDDLTGATFTISNLGGLGIESFTPLLNPPQVAILGVGAIQLKPVRRHGQIAFVDAIGLSLTCDHQVIDGAPGARFLQILRDRIETVESLCPL
jgi:pyruvate dehydrogenase E2 component (dihydrolipoamide acetyltransferase)